MSALTLRLPDSLHRHLKKAAETDGVSVNQFISLAAAEMLSALQAYDLITKRVERSSKEDFLAVMTAVPVGEVRDGDEVPEEYQSKG